MQSSNPEYRRNEEELARSESMLTNPYTDLRLETEGRCEAVKSKQQTPMQLDLLPVKPVASKLHTYLYSLWPQQHFSHEAHTSSNLALFSRRECSEREEKLSSASYPVTGIDINQIPASAESEDPNDFSPASSTLSPFQVDEKRGREREKNREIDDRICEIINYRGASDEEEGCNPRKKLRLSKEQSALLEESFKEHSTLNPKQKQALARQLGLRPRQVEVWFQNRRARTKLKQTEVDCELLKRCCERLAEENRRLQKELHELKSMKLGTSCVIPQDFFMPLPATALSMCPSCERIASVESRPHGFSKASGFTRYVQSYAACS